MTPTDLAKFEPQRRYATLVAHALESIATVTDEIIDLHDRIFGKLFNSAKNKHQQQFQADGKAINNKVRLYGRIGQALIEAKENERDPFAAIESVLPWDDFAVSVQEAVQLAQPEEFDFLHYLKDFNDYLVPSDKFAAMKQSNKLSLAVVNDCEEYLHNRLLKTKPYY